MSQVYNAFTLFLSLLTEAMPFLLLGVLLSSALLLFVDERQLLNKIPKNPILGALVGSSIGFLFPVCECGNVPVARRLLMQGASPAAAIGFLLAAPTINPIVIWSTWVAFRDMPEIVVWRVVFSLGIAIILGCVFSVSKDLTPLLQPSVLRCIPSRQSSASMQKPDWEDSTPTLLQSGTFLLGQPGNPTRMETMLTQPAIAGYNAPSMVQRRGLPKRFNLFLENTLQELRELGGMLILGSAIAAIIQVFVPRELILDLGQGTITSIVAMMLLGALVSICSTVDAFFALSFASMFTGGSLLAFLVFGPMVDIKSVGLMLTIFKPRVVVYLFALTAQLTFALTLLYSYFS